MRYSFQLTVQSFVVNRMESLGRLFFQNTLLTNKTVTWRRRKNSPPTKSSLVENYLLVIRQSNLKYFNDFVCFISKGIIKLVETWAPEEFMICWFRRLCIINLNGGNC